MYPPKVVKKPPFWQIMQNSPTIFQFGPGEMETLHLQRIAQNPLNSPIYSVNHVKLARFTITLKYSLVLKQKLLLYSKCRKIHAIHQSLWRIMQN